MPIQIEIIELAMKNAQTNRRFDACLPQHFGSNFIIFLLFASRTIVAVRIFGIGVAEVMNAGCFVLSFILQIENLHSILFINEQIQTNKSTEVYFQNKSDKTTLHGPFQ